MSPLGPPRSVTPLRRVPCHAGSGYWYPGKSRKNPDVKEGVIVPRLVPTYHVQRMISSGAGPFMFLEGRQPWNGPVLSGPQYTDPELCAAPRTGSPGAFFLPCSLAPAIARQRPPLHLPPARPQISPLQLRADRTGPYLHTDDPRDQVALPPSACSPDIGALDVGRYTQRHR